ncbi:cyclophilin-like fold protein [Flavobacterium sp. XS1P27]|uniref:cyclophilin-like fold protein n=1 Tax=Flavobacterium sp. XS1P27 TaxID=3401724 RepID=UPI003AADFF1C
MKYLLSAFLILVSFTLCLASCGKDDKQTSTQNNEKPNNPILSKMKITVGSSVFTATLYNNTTTKAFKAMLPLTINMSELNGNEKFYYFSSILPSNATTSKNIQTGDLMLYGNNCLVLFYENLNTSYSYTRLGKIDTISGLASTLGNGNVTVKFELE